MPKIAQKFQMTAGHYQGLFAPPIAFHTREEIFDSQIETLVKKKLAQYVDADPFRKRLPEMSNDRFLLTPKPPKVFDLVELMAKVELNGQTGVNVIEAADIKDLGEYPATASLLVDVEDGATRLKVKPKVSRKLIVSGNRHPYNMWRGIIHVVVMPWVLDLHAMDLVGSRYCEDGVPGLCWYAGGPTLHGHWEDRAIPKWGAPSAGSVWV